MTRLALNQAMPIEPNNEDGKLFASWLREMEWDRHGGIAMAAAALGKSPMQIARYRDGANLARDTLLAMTALADDLEPWGETRPAFSLSLKVGRRKKET